MNQIDELRALVGPLDPAAADRISDERLMAAAPTPEEIRRRAATVPATRTRTWQRRWLPVGAIVALAGASVAAAVLLDNRPSTVENFVRCYSVAELTEDPATFTDTAMAGRPGQPEPDISATAGQAIESCAFLWRIGIIQPGRIVEFAGNDEAYVAPPLTACVLASGEAAVFPGNDQTCGDLGLAGLAGR